MNKIKVLLAEDELALAHIVRESLEERDFEVALCHDGEQAFQRYQSSKPDILALDVMMPKLDGFTLAKRIREKDKHTPIIFLTAKSQPKDVVQGFELGANDYLKKPFSVEELIVRIKVLLSANRMLGTTSETKQAKTYQIGSIQFDAVKNVLHHPTTEITLTARESEVLAYLCSHEHQVADRKLLLQTIWGSDSIFNARSLDVFITKLRKHLEADPSVQIINVRGVGYKLVW